MIGIIVALPEEEAPIRRALRGIDREVIVARSGMGRECAARAAASLCIGTAHCDLPPVALLIAAGFSGALRPDLRPGDLVWADAVLHAAGPPGEPAISCWPVSTPDHLGKSALTPQPPLPILGEGELERTATDSLLPELGEGQGVRAVPRVHVGPIVTTDDILATAAAKRDLARRLSQEWHGPPPLAVDLESAGVAAVAAGRGIPFAAIRVISDGADEDLPLDFARCSGKDGQIRRAALVAGLLRQPAALPALLRLGRNSRRAAERLAEYVADVLSGGGGDDAGRRTCAS
jgi:nucleoside phosphorylase